MQTTHVCASRKQARSTILIFKVRLFLVFPGRNLVGKVCWESSSGTDRTMSISVAWLASTVRSTWTLHWEALASKHTDRIYQGQKKHTYILYMHHCDEQLPKRTISKWCRIMNLITVQEEKNVCIFYIYIPDYGLEITPNLVIFQFFL